MSKFTLKGRSPFKGLRPYLLDFVLFPTMRLTPKIRLIALYYSISIYIGMASAVFGPSLPILVEQTGSSLQFLSLIFPARAISYLAGSYLAGLLYDRIQGHRLLAVLIPLVAIPFGLVPVLETADSLIVVGAMMALAMGLADVGCNMLLFRVPDLRLGPAMNGLHFFFGLGSFLAPLGLAASLRTAQGLQWGYWGLAVFSVLILVQFPGLPAPRGSESESEAHHRDQQAAGGVNSALVWVIALFFFGFVGVEVGFGDWLATYITRSGLGEASRGVLLTSIYWGSFTAGRLISIPLAARFEPRTVLGIDLAGAGISLGLMLLFPGSQTSLVIGVMLLGFSVASLFPTSLTFAEDLLPLGGRATSRFFIGGSLGAIILPWLIGRLVSNQEPLIIIQLLAAALVLAVGVYLYLLRQAAGRNPA